MKCYDSEKWYDFLKENVSFEEKNNMINHLKNCDECSEVYFEVASNNILKLDDNISKKILLNVQFEDKKYKYKKLALYIAAASISVFLYSSGIFKYLTEIPKISEQGIKNIQVTTMKFNETYMWSEESLHKNSK